MSHQSRQRPSRHGRGGGGGRRRRRRRKRRRVFLPRRIVVPSSIIVRSERRRRVVQSRPPPSGPTGGRICDPRGRRAVFRRRVVRSGSMGRVGEHGGGVDGIEGEASRGRARVREIDSAASGGRGRGGERGGTGSVGDRSVPERAVLRVRTPVGRFDPRGVPDIGEGSSIAIDREGAVDSAFLVECGRGRGPREGGGRGGSGDGQGSVLRKRPERPPRGVGARSAQRPGGAHARGDRGRNGPKLRSVVGPSRRPRIRLCAVRRFRRYVRREIGGVGVQSTAIDRRGGRGGLTDDDGVVVVVVGEAKVL
mmetsp:Transcript_25139/g.73725  ORF Transcript_25139/g.73725 Transcript_25139/m.73725 type:complete len:308 (+) Transcript_25139:1322-2245(+)